jgi:hypothetical protein
MNKQSGQKHHMDTNPLLPKEMEASKLQRKQNFLLPTKTVVISLNILPNSFTLLILKEGTISGL